LSKDTSLSLGDVLPFTVELEDLAVRQGVRPPWFTDVTTALDLDEAGYQVLGVQFDARSPPFRLDLAGIDPAVALPRIAGLCNDPSYPGYPYPLARIHQCVHFDSGEALDLRRELEAIVARRRGHRMSLRLFGQGRDVLQLAD
jgi:hypothetical protein